MGTYVLEVIRTLGDMLIWEAVYLMMEEMDPERVSNEAIQARRICKASAQTSPLSDLHMDNSDLETVLT